MSSISARDRSLFRTAILCAVTIPLTIPSCAMSPVHFLDVTALRETQPVSHSGDAADDPCIWVHPTEPDKSLVIGTDKQGALVVYDLQGTELQNITGIQPNNVDVRYSFMLGGTPTDIVCASNQQNNSIVVYKVDPDTRELIDVADGTQAAGIEVYGFCLYRSAVTDEYYSFVNSRTGQVRQFKLFDNGAGKVTMTLSRSLSVGSITEGCVADDETGDFYISEENVGIWRYGAEPSEGSSREIVDRLATNPDLTSDLEGLCLYRTAGGGGYLLCSVQGRSGYAVYDRQTGAYLGMFRIVAGGSVDGTNDTDGIDVVNVALGTDFPQGLFVVQDGSNTDPAGNQNFKLVPWERVASAFDPPLSIDSSFRIRP